MTNFRKAILRAQKVADDEYYTQRPLASRMIDLADRYVSKLPPHSNIWLPCDSDTSMITIVAKEKWPQHNIINTSDDLYTHDDILKSADFIITNPPFHGIIQLIHHFDSVPYVMLCPITSVGELGEKYGDFTHRYTRSGPSTEFIFTRPDGTNKYVAVAIVSNRNECYQPRIRSSSSTASAQVKEVTYYEPCLRRVIRRTLDCRVVVGETAAVPASNLEFMRYEDWHFIKSVIVPGCYLSILCTRIR